MWDAQIKTRHTGSVWIKADCLNNITGQRLLNQTHTDTPSASFAAVNGASDNNSKWQAYYARRCEVHRCRYCEEEERNRFKGSDEDCKVMLIRRLHTLSTSRQNYIQCKSAAVRIYSVHKNVDLVILSFQTTTSFKYSSVLLFSFITVHQTPTWNWIWNRWDLPQQFASEPAIHLGPPFIGN